MFSPICTKDNELMVCSYDGHVYRVKEGILSSAKQFQGDVNCFLVSASEQLYVSEISSKSLLTAKLNITEEEPVVVAQSFEGEPFMGISSMVFSHDQ